MKKRKKGSLNYDRMVFLHMTKYYFESKSTGKKVEVFESEYRLVSDSYISNKDNIKQVSHLVVRDNGCDCETTLYVDEDDMPFKERTDV